MNKAIEHRVTDAAHTHDLDRQITEMEAIEQRTDARNY